MTRAALTMAVCATLLWSGTVLATPTEEASLNTCQNAVKVAAAAFVKNKVAAIGTCLQAISTQMVKNNVSDASAAASTCVTSFRKLNDSRSLGKSLPEKLTAGITAKCAPGGSNTHTLGDILGVGAGVSQPLNADDLNAWCSHYGGDGSIDTLQEWMDCISTAAECDVDSAIAAQYPRVLDWLNLVKPSMQALTPPATDPSKITDAVAGLDAVKAEIDGPNNDNVVSLQCGGIVSTGTAVASNCLTGTTFSNGTAGGVAGTMPNNGAVTLTPSTTDQTIALGYHNGLGKCLGDSDLVSGNIKSGMSIFGVAGSSTVVDTNGATATATNILTGQTCYANGSLVTGTVPAGSNVNGGNGLKTFTIPDGLYSGSKTATANDTNLVAGNIVSGVAVFGVTGTQPPSQPLKTGQTTPTFAYGTGSDAVVNNGDERSYTDNGNGTVTDNKTGLMWEKKDQSGGIHDWTRKFTWSGASYNVTNSTDGTTYTSFLKVLNGDSTGCTGAGAPDSCCSGAGTGTCTPLAGHSDWRIPNKFELDTIANLQNASPSVDTAFNTSCAASCTVTSCSCTQPAGYWSSSTYATFPNNTWYVDFASGSSSFGNKSLGGYVRAVRAGSFGATGTQPPSQPLKTGQTVPTFDYGTGSDAVVNKGDARSYTDNGNGTVTDNKTGLMWEKKDQSGGIHDWTKMFNWSGASFGGGTYVTDGTTYASFLKVLNGDSAGCTGAGAPDPCCSGAGTGTCTAFAGHSDWRIPNVNELQTLGSYQNTNPAVDTAFNTSCAASCTVTSCSCTQFAGPEGYWSSSTIATIPNAAWYVQFAYSASGGNAKNGNFYVRAVRAGL